MKPLAPELLLLARTRLCFDFQCSRCGVIKHTNETYEDHLIKPSHPLEECNIEIENSKTKAERFNIYKPGFIDV